MSKKSAIIVGCRGQDGRLLTEYLFQKNYKVIGIDVNYFEASFMFSTQSIDITNKTQVSRLVCDIKPTEIYYLAALHHSSEDNISGKREELYRKSFEINTFSLIYFLEAILQYSPETRLFYASSSHIFGACNSSMDDENTQINPISIYGITKAAGLFVCRHYRKELSLFASCGILYNHESPLRTSNFISKKIINGAIKIKKKQLDKIVLGSIAAEADWGYAPDYVHAMNRILNLSYPDDFIIATGKKHSVKEFAEIAFGHLGLDWNQHIVEDQNLLTRKAVCRIGNSRKLHEATGWKPSIDFKEMVKVLLYEEGELR